MKILEKRTVPELLLFLAAVPAFGLVSSCLSGWVLAILWGWFIVPIFHLPELRMWDAVGIALVASALTHQAHKEEREFAELLAIAICLPLFTLGFGWMIHALGAR